MDTLVLLALLVAVAAIGTLALLGLRRGGGPIVAGDETRQQNAFPYEGMIVGFEEIGDGRDARGPFRALDFAFEIQPPGEAPYQTRTSWKIYGRGDRGLHLGSNVAIRVDRDDPLIVYPDLPGVAYHWTRAAEVQRR